MKTWKFTYELETEAKTKEEALQNFQLQMYEDSSDNPENIGEVKEIK